MASNHNPPPPANFADAELAQRNLARIRAAAPAGVVRALEVLLPEISDPDAALNQFERLVEVSSAEVLQTLDRNPVLVHYAAEVFAHSYWLGETLIQNSDLFAALDRDRGLNRSHTRDNYRDAFHHFRSRTAESDLALLLARFKRREYVRIMLRDVLEIAPLAETTQELSALADVLLEEALQEVNAQQRQRFGLQPEPEIRGFAVLALGKLGGNEVNYSSDIDLLFLYDSETPDAPSREFYIRLAQQVTEVLSRQTVEGPVFRIDLRLRPLGHEGEPAVSLPAALRYYSEVAHDWELQAMIKARHSAGDQSLSRRFLQSLQPHVYRSELNFAAIKTALVAREKIGSKRRRQQVTDPTHTGIDVKLDPGGIRDIEFLVQCLQRVYGGAEPWLRAAGTLFSLSKLHDKAHISGKDFHDLSAAYKFLREIEHRLQLRRGRQIHRLPDSAGALRSLFRSTSPGEPHDYPPAEFVDRVRRRMAAVAAIYERVIFQSQAAEYAPEPAPAPTGRERTLDRLALDAPQLHALATDRALDAHARRNLHRVLSSALTDPERSQSLLRHPHAVEAALPLFAASDYLTQVLAQHPEEIELITHRDVPEPLPLERLHDSRLPYQDRLALLRRHFRRRTFQVAARDVLDPAPLYDSLRTLTDAAEEAIRASLELVGPADDFAVMALGRLGTHEFDVSSDADLVFVRAEEGEGTEARRAAERLLQALTAYTREGTLFPVDVRLRPHGAEGELVVTPSQMREYFVHEGRAWEALSYTKIRWVAGNRELASIAEKQVTEQLRELARDPDFTRQVLAMRQKLEESDTRPMNYKTGRGGFYDVDFVVSWLALHIAPAPAAPVALELERLKNIGAVGEEDYQALRAGADFYRAVDHAARLVTGRGRKVLPATERARHKTEELAQRILRRSFKLEEELPRLAAAVRTAFERVMSAPQSS